MDPYDELYVDTMGRRNFILQHVVDAQIAQNATATNPPHIGVIFSLVGLYLHVEKGFTGTQVQNAHKVMGKMKRSWPDVVWPTVRGNMTAATVLAMPVGQARDEGIDEWCKQVWAAFSVANRGMVASLVSEYRLVYPDLINAGFGHYPLLLPKDHYAHRTTVVLNFNQQPAAVPEVRRWPRQRK